MGPLPKNVVLDEAYSFQSIALVVLARLFGVVVYGQQKWFMVAIQDRPRPHDQIPHYSSRRVRRKDNSVQRSGVLNTGIYLYARL